MARQPAASEPTDAITFQGAPGAYSDLCCRKVYPDRKTLPCETFTDVFALVREGRAGLAMIPIENSVAGRVADIHHFLPDSGLHIIAEHFQRVEHALLAPKGATAGRLRRVHSHVHALSQCRKLIEELGLKALVHADTAGAAADVAESGDPSQAAIASTLAAEIYGLEILRTNIEDAENNTTRFVVMASEPAWPDPGAGRVMTSFIFQVRNVPAALYKVLGGFASNGVNMVKLESYMLDASFTSTQFYAEVEGHPSRPNVKLAFEELDFFSRSVKILGVYPENSFRLQR